MSDVPPGSEGWPLSAEEIFGLVLERAPGKRADFLASVCPDETLRAEVEALLSAHEGAEEGALLDTRELEACGGAAAREVAEQLARDEEDRPRESEQAGKWIDRYKLLEPIGEGGFGTVWMAEQREPIRRRVALKIVKLGMDTRQVVARFEQERQALALMDHPNIARVLDAGATPEGRPYFVMELVRGTPITEFCDREHLGTRDRLDLFVQVCRAVQHAHQKGIIHRDLKPGNILVTVQDGAVPVPKVIDFGVAKAMETPLTEKTLFTRFDQMVGTPAYMCPEQAGADADANDIDTRADIYALGVVLYELLTGTTPFDTGTLHRAAVDELRRILRDQEAPRPSVRLLTMEQGRRTTVASERSTEAAGLERSLRGDLDWIVMKAIEKDRRRRYETANGMAADIERFLADQPVSAGPPTAAYVTAKFLRRHKTPLAVAAAVALLLVAGTAISSWQAVVAKRRLAEAEAISAFLTTMIDRATPGGSGDPANATGTDDTTVTFAEALKQAEARLADDAFIPPQRRAILQDAIGQFNQALEVRDEVTRRRDALRFFTETYGDGHPRTFDAVQGLAKALTSAGRHEEALPYHERALEIHRQSFPDGKDNMLTRDLLWDLIEAYESVGRRDEALELEKERFELTHRLMGPAHGSTAVQARELAEKLWELNRHEEARIFLEKAVATGEARLAALRRSSGSEALETRHAIYGLAWSYAMLGKHQEAIPLGEELVMLWRQAQGEGSINTMAVRSFLADSYRAAGRTTDAIRVDPSRPGVDDPDAPPALATVVGPDGEWRWFHPTDGVDPAEVDPDFHSSFFLPDYDDSEWNTGSDSPDPTGGFAYGVENFTGIDIGLPEDPDHRHTAYFRHRFTTSREHTHLELRCRIDDGLIVYLDGKEVLRQNVEDGEDAYRLPVLWTYTPEFQRIRLPLGALTLPPGDHVLAISVHNANPSSSDLRLASVSLVETGDPPPYYPVDHNAPVARATLVGPYSKWRWLHPLDGVDPAEADPDFHETFPLPGYDDSAWQTGTDSPGTAGGFGYGFIGHDGNGASPCFDIGTPIKVGDRHTAYFRHRFTTDREHANLELRCRYDDGIIVYLDGKEVRRVNMEDGPDRYRLPARSDVDWIQEETRYRLPLNGLTLPPGDHVLAVSLHNAVEGSSDLRLGSFSLVATDPPDEVTRGILLELANGEEARIGRRDDGLWVAKFKGLRQLEDLSKLRGLPLCSLMLWDTGVTDLSPLEGLPLERLYIPRGVEHLDVTRSMKNLSRLSYDVPWQTPAHFWSLRLVRKGDFEAVEEALKAEAFSHVADHESWSVLMVVMTSRGKLKEFMKLESDFRERRGRTLLLWRRSRHFLLGSGFWELGWLPEMEQVRAPEPGQEKDLFARLGWALLAYRKGDYPEALRRVQGSLNPSDPGTPMLLSVSAMAYHQLGRRDEARQSLDQASLILDPVWAATEGEFPTWGWHSWLEARMLRDEAEALLAGKLPFWTNPEAAFRSGVDPREPRVQKLLVEQGEELVPLTQVEASSDPESFEEFRVAVGLAVGSSDLPYREFCARFARANRDSHNLIVQQRVQLATVLRPTADTERLWASLSSYSEEDPTVPWAKAWSHFARALGAYRCGEGAKAKAWLAKTPRPMSPALDANGTLPVLFTLLDALIERQLGHDEEAGRLLDQARSMMPEVRKRNPIAAAEHWQDTLMCELFLEEAQAVVPASR